MSEERGGRGRGKSSDKDKGKDGPRRSRILPPASRL